MNSKSQTNSIQAVTALNSRWCATSLGLALCSLLIFGCEKEKSDLDTMEATYSSTQPTPELSATSTPIVSNETNIDTTIGSTELTNIDATTASGNTTDTSTGSTESSENTPSVDAVVCAPVQGFVCGLPLDCSSEGGCGGFNSVFDIDGCPRTNCGGEETCSEGYTCFNSNYLDKEFYSEICLPSGVGRDEGEGECLTIQTDDCGGSWCIPNEELPGG